MFNLDVRNNPDELFNEAIKQNVLSKNEKKSTYAGKYMYMYSEGNKHFFKNKDTRNYLTMIY